MHDVCVSLLPLLIFLLKIMGKGFLRVFCKQSLRWKVIGRSLPGMFMEFGGTSGRQDERSEKLVHYVVVPEAVPNPTGVSELA